MAQHKLLLASTSPRRRQLLALAGYEFDLRPVDIDESTAANEEPAAYVRRLAQAKARAAARAAAPDTLILAADTTVADGDVILGKPEDAADARRMLASLRGRAHTVYTALALFNPGQQRLLVEHCATRVYMRGYSSTEVEAYVASGDPLDKAGAYAVQDVGFHPVERLQGCYTNVVGLPLCLLQEMMKTFGQRPDVDLPLCPQDYNECSLCSALAGGQHVG